ncbi:MAG TPA: hypothetical protein VL588_06745 [Bdellovibrionota bacterium]|nr:hypothetical protein [Bdellovibrionota bacterium]
MPSRFFRVFGVGVVAFFLAHLSAPVHAQATIKGAVGSGCAATQDEVRSDIAARVSSDQNFCPAGQTATQVGGWDCKRRNKRGCTSVFWECHTQFQCGGIASPGTGGGTGAEPAPAESAAPAEPAAPAAAAPTEQPAQPSAPASGNGRARSEVMGTGAGGSAPPQIPPPQPNAGGVAPTQTPSGASQGTSTGAPVTTPQPASPAPTTTAPSSAPQPGATPEPAAPPQPGTPAQSGTSAAPPPAGAK